MKRLVVIVPMALLVTALLLGCSPGEPGVTPTVSTLGQAPSTSAPAFTTTTASTEVPVTTTSTTEAPETTTSTPTTQPPGDGNEGIAASGNFTRSSHTFETTPGTVLTVRGSDEMEFDGTLDGTWKNQYTMEINPTTGKILNMTADITFTGKVDGKEGKFTATEVATGQMYSADSGNISGHTTIVDGTGELANLRGEINGNATFDAQGLRGTYTGELHFEE